MSSSKPTISRQGAEVRARAYVEGLDLSGWRYEFVSVSESPWMGEWGVVFDTYSPAANLVDGPVVFLVNENTGAVRPLNGD